MNKAEKYKFISCAGGTCIFIMHFSRVSKISWKPSCPCLLVVIDDGQFSLEIPLYILDSFPEQPNHMQQTFAMG